MYNKNIDKIISAILLLIIMSAVTTNLKGVTGFQFITEMIVLTGMSIVVLKLALYAVETISNSIYRARTALKRVFR